MYHIRGRKKRGWPTSYLAIQWQKRARLSQVWPTATQINKGAPRAGHGLRAFTHCEACAQLMRTCSCRTLTFILCVSRARASAGRLRLRGCCLLFSFLFCGRRPPQATHKTGLLNRALKLRGWTDAVVLVDAFSSSPAQAKQHAKLMAKAAAATADGAAEGGGAAADEAEAAGADARFLTACKNLPLVRCAFGGGGNVIVGLRELTFDSRQGDKTHRAGVTTQILENNNTPLQQGL